MVVHLQEKRMKRVLRQEPSSINEVYQKTPALFPNMLTHPAVKDRINSICQSIIRGLPSKTSGYLKVIDI